MQVAAHAQHHLCVRKHQGADGRMHTSIMPLVTQVSPQSSNQTATFAELEPSED